MTRYAANETGLNIWSRSWEVQRAPYVQPLPFDFYRRRETQHPDFTSGQRVNDEVYTYTILDGKDQRMIDTVTNRARANCLKEAKGSGQAALGLTIFSWRSSLEMISGALQALASKRARARLYYRRKASELYLEGIFGWVPLMSDIYQAFEVLGASHSVSPSRAKSRDSRAYRVATAGLKLTIDIDVQAHVGVRLSLDNPNVILLNNLGLLNPASIAWDAVPYSFIINWFTPIGAYLNSLTELLGYGVHDGFVTTFVRKTAAGSFRHYKEGSWTWYPRMVEQIYVNRSIGFPPFELTRPTLPTADLGKALISLALFDSTREPAPRRR